jgi:hypothetical protein
VRNPCATEEFLQPAACDRYSGHRSPPTLKHASDRFTIRRYQLPEQAQAASHKRVFEVIDVQEKGALLPNGERKSIRQRSGLDCDDEVCVTNCATQAPPCGWKLEVVVRWRQELDVYFPGNGRPEAVSEGDDARPRGGLNELAEE